MQHTTTPRPTPTTRTDASNTRSDDAMSLGSQPGWLAVATAMVLAMLFSASPTLAQDDTGPGSADALKKAADDAAKTAAAKTEAAAKKTADTVEDATKKAAGATKKAGDATKKAGDAATNARDGKQGVNDIPSGDKKSGAEEASEQGTNEGADEEDDEKTAVQRWQEAIDKKFAEVNDLILPILFVDVAFGTLDPKLEDIKTQLEGVKKELAGLDADSEDPAVKKQVALLKRTEKNLSGMVETLEKKVAAKAWLEKEGAALEKKIAETTDEDAAKPLKEQLAAKQKEAGTNIYTVPLIVGFLLLGGVFFTFRYGFVNLRMFGHSFGVVRGKYDNPEDHGEISHFQALTSALSATVGLGNIAGVAIAISQGGPGAVFWMWVVAFFGMSSKFSSCTLAQLYRRITPEDGSEGAAKKSEHVLGGPMVYLHEGMKDVFGGIFGSAFGKVLAVVFAFFAIMGSLGGGNLFQGNQTFAIVGDVVLTDNPTGKDLFDQAVQYELVKEKGGQFAFGKTPLAATEAASVQAIEADAKLTSSIQAKVKEKQKGEFAWIGGLLMAALVGVVIVGGIKRIGELTSRLVPLMCVFYVGICLVIVLSNAGEVPAMLTSIFTSAFSTEALAWGGLMGVLVAGVKRGAFSNEAGLGSAAIAHSAAKTDEPVREGIVAMIGPFIDTIIVCTMTALAILITDAHTRGSAGGFSNEGVGITASAFSSLAGWLPYMLTLAVFVFAYSTMISWSYYGERASEYLFGKMGIWPYRVVFLFFVFISPMISLDNVITFTDLLILSMAYPNILGMIFLSGKVAKASKDYVRRLRSGEMLTREQHEARLKQTEGSSGEGI